jgi:putative ABC transport system permease protein
LRAKRKATAEYRLTVAGLALAVATLIVVLGVDGGFADKVETARLAAGDDIVRIMSLTGPKMKEGRLTVRPLSALDYDAVLEGITMGQEVALFSGFSMLNALPPGEYTHEGDEPIVPPQLCYASVSPNFFRLMGLKLAEGRFWDEVDVANRSPLAVAGYGLANHKVPDTTTIIGHYPLGSSVSFMELASEILTYLNEITGVLTSQGVTEDYRVVGVLAETGESWKIPAVGVVGWKAGRDDSTFSTLGGIDYCVFMPAEILKYHVVSASVTPESVSRDARTTFGYQLIVRPTPGAEAESVDEIVRILEERGVEDIHVHWQSRSQALYHRVSTNLNRLFLYVAILSVGLAGINLSNLALVGVIRQARFIGIKRAVGAARLDIAAETVRNSLKVAAVGGLLGLAASLALQKPLSAVIGQACRVNLLGAVVGYAVLILVAFVAALYPAWRAASAQPVTMVRFGLLNAGGRRRKFDARSFLAALGVVVGIATVTSIVAVGDGIQDQTLRFMSAVGKNVIVVREEDWFQAGGSVTRLTPSVLGQVGDEAAGDIEAAGWQEWAGALVRSATSAEDSVMVLYEGDLLSARGFELVAGEWPTSAGAHETGTEAVIGFGLAEALEPSGSSVAEVALGRQISVDGSPFTVVGVLAPREEGTMIEGYDQDKAVFALWTEELSNHLFQSTIPVREIWVRAAEGRFDEAKVRVESLAEELGFAVAIPVGDLEDLSRIMKSLATVLVSLASLGLLVGIVGVSGMMYIKIAEEVRRIGIVRALGATERNVSGDYLRGSLRLCLQAGIAGLLLSLGALFYARSARGVPVLVSWKWATLSVLIAVVSGVGAGWFPAVRAASVSPVEAIRQE